MNENEYDRGNPLSLSLCISIETQDTRFSKKNLLPSYFVHVIVPGTKATGKGTGCDHHTKMTSTKRKNTRTVCSLIKIHHIHHTF